MKPPLVTAILTFSDASRTNLVRKAVNNFIRQNYTPYELVVVNSTDVDVLTNSKMATDDMHQQGCNLVEIKAPKDLNAASMRNIGIKSAHGEWIIPIDDDDWFHPTRLMFQMAHRRGSMPVVLRHQLRVDVSPLREIDRQAGGSFKPFLHLVDKPGNGIASTMLFPRQVGGASNGISWFYDESLNIGEHEELIARVAEEEGGCIVADNSHNTFVTGMHWPILSIAVYHGMNELTFDRFFDGMPRPVDRNIVPPGLVAEDVDQLKRVLAGYNFKVK